MFIEILFLVIIFIVAEVTHLTFFYLVLIVCFFLCLPGIIALNSAPYVPTLKKSADAMLKLSDIKPGMRVYDLGAGDGRLVERAAKKGANAVGYEISFALFVFFWLRKAIFMFLPCHSRPPLSFPRKQKTLRRVNFGGNLNAGISRVYWGSIWRKDISDADVVMCFLMPRAMARFEKKKFGTMKKGSRLISNIFPLPNTMEDKKESNVYVYLKK